MGYYRHPRTTQELRANEGSFSRPKRTKKYLPNSYWDISRHSDEQHCWKRNRKTQYKPVDMFEKKKKNSDKFGYSMSCRDHFHLEHKWCMSKRRRCSYCVKNNIWEESDNKIKDMQEKYVLADEERIRKFFEQIE